MTDPTPSSEETPRPDGLPRRRGQTRGAAAAAAAGEPGPTAEGVAGSGAAAAEEIGTRGDAQSEGDARANRDEDEPAASEDRGAARDATAEAGEQAGEQAVVSGLSSLQVAHRIVEAAEDKKAADIVLLDVSELTTMADYFVICSGGSERQLGAIADGIAEQLRGDGVRPIGREGGSSSHWTLLDFGSVVVHIFAPPEREYYQLERHWSKAKTLLRVQ